MTRLFIAMSSQSLAVPAATLLALCLPPLALAARAQEHAVSTGIVASEPQRDPQPVVTRRGQGPETEHEGAITARGADLKGPPVHHGRARVAIRH